MDPEARLESGYLGCLGFSTNGVYNLNHFDELPPAAVMVGVPMLLVVVLALAGHVVWIRRLREAMVERQGVYYEAAGDGSPGGAASKESSRTSSRTTSRTMGRAESSQDLGQTETMDWLGSATSSTSTLASAHGDRRFSAIGITLPSDLTFEERRRRGSDARLGDLRANLKAAAFAGKLKSRVALRRPPSLPQVDIALAHPLARSQELVTGTQAHPRKESSFGEELAPLAGRLSVAEPLPLAGESSMSARDAAAPVTPDRPGPAPLPKLVEEARSEQIPQPTAVLSADSRTPDEARCAGTMSPAGRDGRQGRDERSPGSGSPRTPRSQAL